MAKQHSIVKIRIETLPGRAAVAAVMLACFVLTVFAAKWNFANAVSTRVKDKDLAALAAGLSPRDPQTRYTAAVIYERSFEAGDLERSLSEYEHSAAAAPYNYLSWLALGAAKVHAGEPDKGELALARALKLAPNYADVQWAYGMALLRRGDGAAYGFLRSAMTGNSKYAVPAVTAILQGSDGEIGSVREALGDTQQVNAAAAAYFIFAGRYDAARSAWERAASFSGDLKPQGEPLIGPLMNAKQYRLAYEISRSIGAVNTPPDTIFDGGFETGVKIRGAGVFEWNIGEGSEPQIALSTAQFHSGANSLMLVFNARQASEFRSVSRLAAVEPGTAYVLSAFYRADLKAASTVRFEAVDAATGAVLTRTPDLAANADWTRVEARFTTSRDGEGVIVRLVRSDCAATICPISGTLWIDDIAIAKQ
ncbi:MAG: hypothetical protein HS105_12470 [Chloracidobacterium sp.]|nr:hypothetical protein [Chloracidobacterium sp.]MCO5332869.1 hypothetical protein [Pyrinomonadaceae bacterium]